MDSQIGKVNKTGHDAKRGKLISFIHNSFSSVRSVVYQNDKQNVEGFSMH